MYCSKCGNELKDSEQFCPKCGARTEKVKEEIKKSYEKEYEVSKRTLKMSLISALIVTILSIILNNFIDFGPYVGKYLLILAGITGIISLGCCYYFSIKGHIKQETWIQVVLGILIAAIIISSISAYFEYSQDKKFQENMNYYRHNY